MSTLIIQCTLVITQSNVVENSAEQTKILCRASAWEGYIIGYIIVRTDFVKVNSVCFVLKLCEHNWRDTSVHQWSLLGDFRLWGDFPSIVMLVGKKSPTHQNWATFQLSWAHKKRPIPRNNSWAIRLQLTVLWENSTVL